MSFGRWSRLRRCMQGVPTRQLARRVWLMAGRRLAVSAPLDMLRPRRTGSLPLSATLPQRRLPPRTSLVQHDGARYWLAHLNRRYELTPPVDWMLSSCPDSTDLQRLAMHYHEFLEAVPAEVGRDLILDWIASNPPWQPRYWMTSWNCYGLSIRCVCWMQWLETFPDLCTDSQRTTILESIVEQVRFLCHNLETDIRGNHLIRNIRCLFWASRFFTGDEPRRWSAIASRHLQRELDAQLLPDGMHFELSPAYHCQVLCDLLEVAALLDDAPRQQLLDRLQPAVQAVRILTHPDGLISLFSDGGLNMAYAPRDCIRLWESLGRSAPAESDRRELPDAGYYGYQSSRTWLLVDCGRVCADALPAHGHADMLSFEWDVDGQRIVVDPGVYEYEAGERRAFSRSTAAHNTVQVGELEQAELIGSFRTGRRAAAHCESVAQDEGRWKLKGSHPGFQLHGKAFRCARQFVATDTSLHVVDDVSGAAGTPCLSRVLLHPSCAVETVSDREVVITNGSTRIRLTSDAPVRVVEAEWSPDFGVAIPASRLEFDYGQTPCHAGFELRITK